MAVGRQPWAVELEHVFGRELFQLLKRLALNLFKQHGGRGLADNAALALEVAVDNFAVVVELNVNLHHVAAKRVLVFVRMSCGS